MNDIELTGPIVFKSTPERIAFAAVLVPGEPDLDADKGEKILTVEEVERVANQWLADYSNIDLLHSLNNVAVPVQSFTTYSDRTVKVNGEDLKLPKGTWILGSRLDEPTWDGVMDGTLTGYSVMGIRRSALKQVIGAMKSEVVDLDASLKKTLLKDLGPDWVAPFVSVVDTPAVPKSKWFALKSADSMTWYEKIKSAMPRVDAEKAGRRHSDSTYRRIKLAFDAIKDLLDEADGERRKGDIFGSTFKEAEKMDEATLKELITEATRDALSGVSERIEKLEAEKAEAEKAEAEKAAAEKAEADKVEAEKATDLYGEITARLDKLEAVKSRALKGQDGGDATESASIDRDLYGRKRKEV